jgi:thiamine-monophosphate kinase
VGAKLLKRNLSDIAAMGGRPVAAVLSLALAPATRTAWLRQFYVGLAAAARQYGVKIVGGDIAEAPAGFFGAFLTLHGEADRGRVLTRRGARRGDAILVTGNLGGSLAGHHHRFAPRLAEGQWLVRQREVVSMMDLTDGIAKDIWALTPTGAVAAIDPSSIPVSAAARRLARHSRHPAYVHALCDGEDYELLLVVRGASDLARFQARWNARFQTPLHVLGRFERRLGAGHVDWTKLHGYEHLR